MIFTTCSSRPRIVSLISSGSGMRTMTTQKARRRSGGTRVRLGRLISLSRIWVFTVPCKPSFMLVLLRHGKQNIFNFAPHPSVRQLSAQRPRALRASRARYHSISTSESTTQTNHDPLLRSAPNRPPHPLTTPASCVYP